MLSNLIKRCAPAQASLQGGLPLICMHEWRRTQTTSARERDCIQNTSSFQVIQALGFWKGTRASACELRLIDTLIFSILSLTARFKGLNVLTYINTCTVYYCMCITGWIHVKPDLNLDRTCIFKVLDTEIWWRKIFHSGINYTVNWKKSQY